LLGGMGSHCYYRQCGNPRGSAGIMNVVTSLTTRTGSFFFDSNFVPLLDGWRRRRKKGGRACGGSGECSCFQRRVEASHCFKKSKVGEKNG
jgi:hypothetical protein